MTLEQDLEADLGRELALAAESLRQVVPEDSEIDRHADVHRRALATYERRQADARKQCKARVAEMEAEKRRLKAEYEADMARLAEGIASTKAAAEADAATAATLAAVSRAALELLVS